MTPNPIRPPWPNTTRPASPDDAPPLRSDGTGPALPVAACPALRDGTRSPRPDATRPSGEDAIRPFRDGESSEPTRDREFPGLTIRAYRQDDIGLIQALSDRLSSQSLYHRFFVGTPRIPLNYLRSLKKVDHQDREVLIALHEDVHAVAIAEYTRDTTDPRTADLAVLVADEWQHHGLARVLLDALGNIALSHGITHFKADVLPDNRPAQSAIHRHRPGSPSTRDPGGLRRFLLTTHPAPTKGPRP